MSLCVPVLEAHTKVPFVHEKSPCLLLYLLEICVLVLLRFCRIALVVMYGLLLASHNTLLPRWRVTLGFLRCLFRFLTVWNILFLLMMLCGYRDLDMAL